MSRSVMQQARDALNMMRDEAGDYACPACDHADAAVYALEKALAEPEQPRSLSDELMDCVDRLGFEFDTVDPRVWDHLLVYAPKPEPAVPEQDIEDAIEAAYWHFDARRKGYNEWASAPQSERDAFKAEARKLAKGYFPTRQAQDTKREMLAVADAFIRGKASAPTPRKPLTDEEIVQVLGSIRESITGSVFLAFARAIEAAHGIGEQT